jgi:hypothetical protein
MLQIGILSLANEFGPLEDIGKEKNRRIATKTMYSERYIPRRLPCYWRYSRRRKRRTAGKSVMNGSCEM